MSDAMTVSFGADEDAWEWDESLYCYTCGGNTLMGVELRAGRVMGCCEHCQEVHDFTPPDDDDEPAPYADGVWPCHLRRACGCAGLIDCPRPPT